MTNAVETILKRAKRPQPGAVNYLERPGYAHVPEYLSKVKAEVDEEYEAIQRAREEEAAKEVTGPKMRLLPEEERLTLVEGLKKQWEEVNRHYQTISLAMHTTSQKQAKEKDEARLAEIEKDIERLSKKEVWVYDDEQ